MSKKKGRWVVGVATAIVVIAGGVFLYDWLTRPPGTRPEQVMSLSEVQQVFAAEDGWIALPLAESNFKAGSIIRVDAEGRPLRISHLSVCGYPESVLLPDTSHLVSLSFERELQLGVGLVGAIEGVDLGPEAKRARAVSGVIDSITTETIDLLRIRIWQDEDANFDLVSRVCLDQFTEPDHFVVAEAARVNAGTYAFYDSAWAKIEATAENLPELLDLGGEAGAAATQSGSVRISRPVTVAIRNAEWVGDRFAPLQAPFSPVPLPPGLIPSADDRILEYVSRQLAVADTAGR